MIYIHTISCYMGEWIGINSIHQMMRQKVCSSNVGKVMWNYRLTFCIKIYNVYNYNKFTINMEYYIPILLD